MIKNIPNKYSQQRLLQELNEFHSGLFDFFYLPIDNMVIFLNFRINAIAAMLSSMWFILTSFYPLHLNSKVENGEHLKVKRSVLWLLEESRVSKHF